MTDDLVQRANRLDLSGMNFAGLARLSFELDDPEESRTPNGEEDAEGGDTPKKAFRLLTGRDIKSREQQEQDGRRFVVAHGGNYIHTYDEPDTSAWKRKRVRLPDGRVVYRVIRPVFDQALNDLRRGIGPNGMRLDGLIVYDIDRLTRDNRDLEDAIDTVTKFHRPILDGCSSC
ncbi:MAG: recombinase family protein [Actinocrinis sp.]